MPGMKMEGKDRISLGMYQSLNYFWGVFECKVETLGQHSTEKIDHS